MTYRAISLGAGQGSTALAIAIADKLVTPDGYDFGAIPCDRVTFSDTGGELEATYVHLFRLTAYLAARGMTVETVRANGGRTLAQKVLARVNGEIKGNAPAIPFHLAPEGRAKQFCTYDFKGVPLDRAVKKAATKAGKRNDVEILIGFTVEEWMRCRDPRKEWPSGWRFRYPMIEARVNRGWCQGVCRAALGYIPEPSACSFCPHRRDVGPGSRAWIKEHEPETWAQVVAFDAAIRNGYGGLRQKAFVSELRLPVNEALNVAQAQGEFWAPNGSKGCDDGRCFT